MLIGEPELTCHQTIGILRLGQVCKHLVSIIIQGIHMVDRELAVYTRGILAHGKVNTRLKFLSIGPHLHFSAERVDIQFEGLQGHFIHTSLFILFLQELSCLVGTILCISAPLIFSRTQLLNNPFVMRQILRRNL